MAVTGGIEHKGWTAFIIIRFHLRPRTPLLHLWTRNHLPCSSSFTLVHWIPTVIKVSWDSASSAKNWCKVAVRISRGGVPICQTDETFLMTVRRWAIWQKGVHRQVTQILAQEHPGCAVNEKGGSGKGWEGSFEMYLAAHWRMKEPFSDSILGSWTQTRNRTIPGRL